MEINPSEVTKILKEQIKNFGDKAEVTEVGQVLSVGDGIARIYGLDNVQAGEMVEFADGSKGMALNLESENVGVVIFAISSLDNSFADFNSALSSPLFLEQISIKLLRIRSIKKKRLFWIKKLKKFLNKDSNLLFSEIVFITFSKSSWLVVGSLIKLEKSSLWSIKLRIDEDWSSIWLKRLFSSESSKSAREYLSAEVIENPVSLLNLVPL